MIEKGDVNKVVTILVVFAMIGMVVITMGCTEDDEGGAQDSPESTFNTFVERVNEEDGEGALEVTDASLLEDEKFDDRISTTQEKIDKGNLSLSDHEIHDVTYKEDMDSEKKEAVDEIIKRIEGNSSATVDDSVLLNVTITADSETDTVKYPMVQVDSEWYLVFFSLIPASGGSSTEQVTGSIGSIEKISSESWKFTIASISEDLGVSEFTFVLEKSNSYGQTEFTSDQNGVQTVLEMDGDSYTLNYTDIAANGALNAGDYITITGGTEGSWRLFEPGDYTLRILYQGNEVVSATFTVSS